MASAGKCRPARTGRDSEELPKLAASPHQAGRAAHPSPVAGDRRSGSILGDIKKAYSGDEFVYTVRGRELRIPFYTESLSHTKIPKDFPAKIPRSR